MGFNGCIRNVTVDGELLDLEDYIDQSNSEGGCQQIDSSCGVEGACGAGTCVPSLAGFSCICPAQVAGDNCQEGKPLED